MQPSATAGRVEIHYLRLPDRRTVFRQDLVHREDGCIITLMDRTPLPAPVRAGGSVILEPDAPVVWFTFEDAWHDIGRFHDARGNFTGWYANILEPVRFHSPLAWETTDLFLDIWHDRAGRTALLDEDELEEALARGWIDEAAAAAARAEAARLLEAAGAGSWPPPIAREWTLARAGTTLTRSRATGGGTRGGSAV
jgi:predicted RNA-binding protein associated with RNAse of E/G family